MRLVYDKLYFDYAHVLPFIPKCSTLHGHTAKVIVEIEGDNENDIIVEFGELKNKLKGILDLLDHKLIINKKYIVNETLYHYELSFDSALGSYYINVPKHAVLLLDREASIENICDFISKRFDNIIANYDNVKSTKIVVYEGIGKYVYIVSDKV